MTRLTLFVLAYGFGGATLLYLLWGTTLLWNWRSVTQLPQKEIARRTPFWVAWLTLLGMASIVFCIHALLVMHGVLR